MVVAILVEVEEAAVEHRAWMQLLHCRLHLQHDLRSSSSRRRRRRRYTKVKLEIAALIIEELQRNK
jgi:hypothetical protein